MAWVRDGDAPEEVKVSFVVNKDDHPELVEWLWGLPFRKQSSVIRDVLSEAAKMVSTEAARPRGSSEKPQTDKTATPSRTAPMVAASSVIPQGSTAMTEATATILRNQQRDF